jgi:hypothetical protein
VDRALGEASGGAGPRRRAMATAGELDGAAIRGAGKHAERMGGLRATQRGRCA